MHRGPIELYKDIQAYHSLSSSSSSKLNRNEKFSKKFSGRAASSVDVPRQSQCRLIGNEINIDQVPKCDSNKSSLSSNHASSSHIHVM